MDLLIQWRANSTVTTTFIALGFLWVIGVVLIIKYEKKSWQRVLGWSLAIPLAGLVVAIAEKKEKPKIAQHKSIRQYFSMLYGMMSALGLSILLLEKFISPETNVWKDYFRYWTLQTNIAITFLFIFQFWYDDNFKYAEEIKIILVSFIAITGIIFWAALFPQHPETVMETWKSILANLVLHTLTPIVAVVEFIWWYKRRPEKKVKYWTILFSLIYVEAFCIMGIVDYVARGSDPVYFFFDYHKLGRLIMWFFIVHVIVVTFIGGSIYLVRNKNKIFKNRKIM